MYWHRTGTGPSGVRQWLLTALWAHAATLWVELHDPAGGRFEVSTEQISALRPPAAVGKRHTPEGTKCIVFMTNGNQFAVRETCDQVRALIAP